MSITKARQLAEFIANADVDSDEIATGAVSASKLAATLDLSSKTIVLPDLDQTLIIDRASSNGTPIVDLYTNKSQGEFSKLRFYNQAYSSIPMATISAQAPTANVYGRLDFQVNNGGVNETIMSLYEDKVGIGETSPDYRLEVKGTATTNTDIVGFSNSNGTVKHIFGLENVGAGRYSIRDASNNTAVFFSAHDADNSYVNAGSFLVGTTNADVGGSVIGIALKNNGAILASTDGTGLGTQPLYADRRGTNNEGDILMLALGGYYKSSIGVIGTNSGSNNGGITFNTISNNVTKEERVRIDASGNVGIGTIGPSARLDVVSNSASGYVAEFRESNASNFGTILIDSPTDGESRPSYMDYATGGTVKWSTGLAYLDAARSFHIGTGSGTSNSKVTIDTSGKVGIGTTTPTEKLHVYGSGQQFIKVETTTTGAGAFVGMRMQDGDGDLGSIGDFGSGRRAFMLDTGSGVDMMFFTNNQNNSSATPRMTITSGGNIGIGTDDPNQLLQVQAPYSASGVHFPITVGGRNHLAGYAAGIGFDPEGYGNRNKLALVTEGISQGWSRGKFHFLMEPTTGNSNEATLSDKKLTLEDSGVVTLYGGSTSTQIWTNNNETGMNSGGYSPGGYLWVNNLNVRNWRGGLDRGWGDYPSITIQNDTGAGTQGEFRIHGIGGVSGGDFSIATRCDGGYITGSDSRRKTNIESVTNALDIVNQLDGKRFNIVNKDLEVQEQLSQESTGKKFGFIAQDVLSVIPEAVKYYENEDTPEENGYASAYSMDYASLVPLLTNAIKEQQTIIDDLKARIEALEG